MFRHCLIIASRPTGIEFRLLFRSALREEASTLYPNTFSAGFCRLMSNTTNSDKPVVPLDKAPKDVTEKEWRDKLTPDQYYICRQKGTEPAYHGRYVNTKTDGVYHCVACDAPLFSSEHKYVSTCGWPAFFMAMNATPDGDESRANVRRKEDPSLGMKRTEVLCKQCDSHLGHVFPDGPLPTKERFCINSMALNFKPSPKK